MEVCALRGRVVTSGYFDDMEKLCQKRLKELKVTVAKKYDGVYYTLNPCKPALLARRKKNMMHERVDTTTTDREIVKRCWLPVDCDFKRPKGISSTAEELMSAETTMEAVRCWLSDQGWSEPVAGLSGNGYHDPIPRG